MAKRMTFLAFQGLMWGNGMPTTREEAQAFTALYRSLLKAGLDDGQAWTMVRQAYHASKGYSWLILEDAGHVKTRTMMRNADENPRCKDAFLLGRKDADPGWAEIVGNAATS